MGIDDRMTQFRLASRQLFNQFYRVHDPYNNKGWAIEERFSRVEEALFQTLVIEPSCFPNARYGQANANIRAVLKPGEIAPVMLNRDRDSGYWDYPITEITQEAQMCFVRFFDWDQLDVRDNRYVRVLVQAWPSKPEAEHKHALIESQYVRFVDA